MNIVHGAASAGQLELIQHLHEIREEPFGSVVGHIRVAAANGHLAVVAFLNESREPCYRNFHQHGDSTAMDQAATNGHLKIVQYLHENHHQGSCTSAAMEGAVLSRHVEVVQFLHEHSYEGCSSQAMMDAVKNSQFEALQLLCDHRGENSSVEPSLQLATDLGRLKYVKFMYNELSSACLAIATSAAIVSSAAASGSLELIQFFHLHDQHFQFSRDTMHSAAVNGHLSIVKFLHEHRSEGCDVRTLFQCDERGHARVLEFLCLSRPIANPVAAIAKAKTQGRFVLVTMLERNSMSLAKKKYVYR